MDTNLHEYEWTAAASQTSRSALRKGKRLGEFKVSIIAKPLRLVEDDTAALQCAPNLFPAQK